MNNCILINQKSLDEVDQFLERHKLPKMTQEETDNLRDLSQAKTLKQQPKKLSKKKSLESDGFTGEFYHTFKEELISMFHKFLPPQNKRGGNTFQLIL